MAPTLKLSRSPEITKPAKSRTASEPGCKTDGDDRDHVAADGVLEGMELDAADAVAEIDKRSAGVAADDAVGAAEIRNPGVARNLRHRLHLPGERLKTFPPGVGPSYQESAPRGEQRLGVGADGH